MSIRDIIAWLSACPVLAGEALIPDFLPSHKGWSITADRQSVRTDILGNRTTQRRVKITRRVTVPDADTRLAVLEQLEDLAEWARENPPTDGSVRLAGLPEYQSRASSGTEDFIVYLSIVSDE